MEQAWNAGLDRAYEDCGQAGIQEYKLEEEDFFREFWTRLGAEYDIDEGNDDDVDEIVVEKKTLEEKEVGSTAKESDTKTSPCLI